MRNKNIFFCLPWGPAQRGGACAVNSERSGEFAQGGIHFRPSIEKIGNPHGPVRVGVGKKKMRTLGTVQLPTEAFMAVLKLDEE